MHRTISLTPIAAALLLLLAGCRDSAELPEQATQGPNPSLPAPKERLIPTLNIAKATGWKQGETPEAAKGLAVSGYATGLDHPRWLYVLPNGDVLVAETNTPKQEGSAGGGGVMDWIKGKVMIWAMNRAGAGVPSPNRIVLLRDADGDGVAETKSVFLKGLNSPFGMALIGDKLYVADTDALLRFDYQDGATEIAGEGTKVAELPAGPINYHWTKSLAAAPDGSRLYVGIGSNSNAGENGLGWEKDRARIVAIDPATGQVRPFATGLRNPVGLAFEPQTGVLWAVVNERDELGSDLVPDYLTSVRDGAFYGWPFSYWGQHVDDRVKPQNPEAVAAAISPDYALGNHVAPLGLAFAQGALLPEPLRTRRVHRRARLVEPRSARRLQGGVRAVRARQAVGPAGRRADRFCRGRRGARAPGRRRHRQGRSAARRRRCRQHGVARDAGRSHGDALSPPG